MVTGRDLGVEFYSIEALEPLNSLPAAKAGGPYTLQEGGSLTLDTIASEPRGQTWVGASGTSIVGI